MIKKYEVAAYYVPVFHPDVKQQEWHGKGWTEWDLVKRAEPRFEGHQQPKIPAWGYEDESDPAVMQKKIDAAADHGLTALIFDWYWYDNGPFLQHGLEEGFLKASNVGRIKFALMWANHDWYDWHPGKRNGYNPKYMDGPVKPETFIEATDHMIKTYFGHPSYWRVNGGLYLSFYLLSDLITGLGGVANTRKLLEGFRERVRTAGLGELHLNAIDCGIGILPGEGSMVNENDLLIELGFDSVTSYVWVHYVPMETFPTLCYEDFRTHAVEGFRTNLSKYFIPYFPNVTMGWDPSPRTVQSEALDNVGYPYTAILEGNTPQQFKKTLEQAKAYLDSIPAESRIMTLNAWNEWTEGSYLEPDSINGMGYLEAIRDVFGK